jgi:hypothetical protein
MSYAMSSALQTAVYQRLTTDTTLTGLVGAAIYDALPSGTLPSLYVSLGPETVTEASDSTAMGAEHIFTISVFSDQAGFQAAKDVAGAVSEALHEAPLTLSRGHLVSLRFQKATAKRVDTNSVRQIDLTFRARLEDI